MKRNTL